MVNNKDGSKKYDLVIGNPPYKKVGKDTPEAQAMLNVCYGALNLYFLFAAMGLFNLKDEEEINVLNHINKWNHTLPDMGLKMRTGLTVDFRNREVLRSQREKGAIPLFYSQHISEGKITFPIEKENEYLVTKKSGLLQENKNYLFVKRFTSKEENRRLQSGFYE